MPDKETYDKDEILQALDEVEGRIAGIRFILEQCDIPDIEVEKQEVEAAAAKAVRVSRRKGC